MKSLLKHLIVGVILSTIFAIVGYKFFNTTHTLSVYLINIPLGTITYTLIKLVTGWFYRHFTLFGKNVFKTYIMDMLIWPLIGAGWYAIFLSLAYFGIG
jgi:hypothetical protein